MSIGIEYAARPPRTAIASDMTVTAIGFRSEARIRPFIGQGSPIGGGLESMRRETISERKTHQRHREREEERRIDPQMTQMRTDTNKLKRSQDLHLCPSVSSVDK